MCGSMELHFVTNKILTKFITGSLTRILWWYNCNHKFHTFWSSETESSPSRDFLSSFDSCLLSRISYGRFYLSLTWKPANLQIMDFYVELCDGIIRIHFFRTTFLRLSYNPLWDVVPRDNGSIDDLFGWCLIVSDLTMFWTLDIQESDALSCNKSNVLPWID
jgi:hypothetical protein